MTAEVITDMMPERFIQYVEFGPGGKLRIERLSEDEQAAAQRWIEHEAALASARQ
jgi:hypothetical protein